MKKTKSIRLVLITAALASCEREFVPQQSFDTKATDSTLTAAPAADTTSYLNNCIPCNQVYAQYWNYGFYPSGFYYVGPFAQNYYYAGKEYGKKIAWKGNHIIVRGGWGKSGASTASS